MLQVVIVSVPGVTVISRLAVARCAVVSESAACTVNFDDPDPVAAPKMAPVYLLIDKPAGKVPELIDHVYGGSPPLAAKVLEYSVPVVALGRVVVVIFRGDADSPTNSVAKPDSCPPQVRA